jgi:phosphatidylglycerol:prolipoprotein diacylglycerol transferase
MVGELFREPDPQLGFIIGPVTMGQLLSVPMALAGAFLIARARRLPAVTPG